MIQCFQYIHRIVHHHHQFQNISLCLEGNLICISSHLPFHLHPPSPRQLLHLLSFMSIDFPNPDLIHQCCCAMLYVLSVWLLSLSVVSSMLQHVCRLLHCFLLNCVEKTHFYLFIHGNLCCCTFLTIVNNAGRIFVYKLLYKCVFSFLLGLYLGVELLGHMVTLCLNS